MPDLPVAAGDLLADKYRVERVLGEGGMGIVVAARHVELEQRVAIKFLKPSLAERRDVAERFRREARAVVRIRSEHVARVLDVGATADGLPYMVMEFLEGRDLAQEMASRGKFPTAEAVTYIAQAIEAVAAAHAAGIVHRDLKPANLFLTELTGGARLVKVLDFGISKSLLDNPAEQISLTKTSTLIGSPMYMSPEQMRAPKGVDERTDIWALGAILYHLLAGRPPFRSDTLAALCSALLNETPQAFANFRDDVPADCEAVILRCLEKDRRFRWATVGQFAEALVPFGPPSVKDHAERAIRILGMTEITMDSASSNGPAVDAVDLDQLGPAGVDVDKIAVDSVDVDKVDTDKALEPPWTSVTQASETPPANSDPTRHDLIVVVEARGASNTQQTQASALPVPPPADALERLPASANGGADSTNVPRWMLWGVLIVAGAGWLAYALKQLGG